MHSQSGVKPPHSKEPRRGSKEPNDKGKLDGSCPRAYDIAAYYWPAYHDEPRWRRFMPEGIGEWETVRRARPGFKGHYQPRVPAWGYEDEADPAVMEKKIAAAADHGVNVFLFDWYWYGGRPFLEQALNRGFLRAPNRERMRFYLMWANHHATTLWDLQCSHESTVIYSGTVRRPGFERATQRMIDCYFSHPGYYRINGCPVLSIYELGSLIRGLGGIARTRAAIDGLRERVRAAGFPDLHLQAVLWRNIPASVSEVPGDRTPTQNHTVEALGFDSLTNYQWCHYVPARGDYGAWARKAMAAWDPWADEFSMPFFPHVSIGWDTNPRYKEFKPNIITGATPRRFEYCLRKAMEFIDRRGLSPRLITVNSWNEWTEGSYLEPDLRHGMGYLEAVRRCVQESRSPAKV